MVDGVLLGVFFVLVVFYAWAVITYNSPMREEEWNSVEGEME